MAAVNVYILPFKFKYLEQLKEMHLSRDNALGCDLTMKDLPKIGYIAFIGKHPVAAGFLRRVEPSYGQLDTFLSNPYFGSQIRHQGLTLVTDALLQDAKDLGLSGVLAFTKDASILDRAIARGFKPCDSVLMSLKLP